MAGNAYRLRFAGPGLAKDWHRRRCSGILVIFLRRRRKRFLGILCFSFRCPFAFTPPSTQLHVLFLAPRYLLGFHGRLALHLAVYRSLHNIRVRSIQADVEQKSAIDVAAVLRAVALRGRDLHQRSPHTAPPPAQLQPVRTTTIFAGAQNA